MAKESVLLQPCKMGTANEIFLKFVYVQTSFAALSMALSVIALLMIAISKTHRTTDIFSAGFLCGSILNISGIIASLHHRLYFDCKTKYSTPSKCVSKVPNIILNACGMPLVSLTTLLCATYCLCKMCSAETIFKFTRYKLKLTIVCILTVGISNSVLCFALAYKQKNVLISAICLKREVVHPIILKITECFILTTGYLSAAFLIASIIYNRKKKAEQTLTLQMHQLSNIKYFQDAFWIVLFNFLTETLPATLSQVKAKHETKFVINEAKFIFALACLSGFPAIVIIKQNMGTFANFWCREKRRTAVISTTNHGENYTTV